MTASHSPLSLSGRHAVVTGGARGIGLAVARQLLHEGARVTIMGRSTRALDEAVAALQPMGSIVARELDVADSQQVRTAFESVVADHGEVDILVNNAGQAISKPLQATSDSDWQRMLAVNLSGTFFCSRAVLPGMVRRDWGRIINVASTAGLIGYSRVAAYCAAKHGVVGLTRALALEVARQGVTVNAICPGYTDTDIVREAVASMQESMGLDETAARQRLTRRNPQGRLVLPDEVAQAVAWLCQPGAAAINGQAIPVDGGEVMAG